MHRALYNSLTKTANACCVSRSVRFVAPQVSVCNPQRLAFRFNSTNASKEAAKEEASKEEVKSEEEQSSGAESEAQEADPLAELKDKLEKKDKELASMKNHYARAIADFRHLQETTKTEVQKAKDFALQKFAKDLLDSLDNFNLALGHVKEDTLKLNDEVRSLYKYGIEKIDPIDQVFDPNLHEATFQMANPGKEPGTVFHVQQVGYTLNERVLRPAKVGVVKSEDDN